MIYHICPRGKKFFSKKNIDAPWIYPRGMYFCRRYPRGWKVFGSDAQPQKVLGSIPSTFAAPRLPNSPPSAHFYRECRKASSFWLGSDEVRPVLPVILRSENGGSGYPLAGEPFLFFWRMHCRRDGTSIPTCFPSPPPRPPSPSSPPPPWCTPSYFLSFLSCCS